MSTNHRISYRGPAARAAVFVTVPSVLLLITAIAVALPQPPAETREGGARVVANTPSTDAVAFAGDFEFIGSRKCRRCHLKEYRSWEDTLHASVFDLLQPGERVEAKELADLDPDADYTEDPNCVRCHAVGVGGLGGFESLSASGKELAGVGCESCHGAGSEYGTAAAMGPDNKNHSFASVIEKGLIYPVPEEVCVRCHNAESPFNTALDEKYAFEYSRQSLELSTHDHPALKNDHGPFPPGVLFQGASSH